MIDLKLVQKQPEVLAKALADRSPDRRRFQRLEAAYKERKEIWDKN